MVLHCKWIREMGKKISTNSSMSSHVMYASCLMWRVETLTNCVWDVSEMPISPGTKTRRNMRRLWKLETIWNCFHLKEQYFPFFFLPRENQFWRKREHRLALDPIRKNVSKTYTCCTCNRTCSVPSGLIWC